MRALCLGDIHLGTRTHGIDRLEDQAEVLGAVAGVAAENGADVILCGGDVFEGPLLDPREEAVFAEFVYACRVSGTPVVTITGNGRHDLGSREAHALTVFRHVPGIVVADTPLRASIIGGVSICALPWTPVGPLVAQHGDADRDDLNVHAAELLVSIARSLRADCDGPAVLLLHWSISGASLPTGLAIDEHAREPILPLYELAELGFDAVVASHIHKPQVMHEQPPVFYTGSPLPLNFGESGHEHGCWLLDVGDGPAVAEFVPLPSRRLLTLEVGPSGLEPLGWPSVDGAIVKVRAAGVERRSLERDLLDAGAHRVVVEAAQVVRASRARVADASAEMSEDAAVRAWCTANDVGETDRDGLLALAGEWAA